MNIYRYLLYARVTNYNHRLPKTPDSEWIKFISIEDLKSQNESGKLTFVDEFSTNLIHKII